MTIPTAMQSFIGQAITDTMVAMARLRGVGGETWNVTSPASGLGGSPTSAGTVTGKAVQVKLGQAGATAPGGAVDVIVWRFVAFSGTLRANQQIADGTYTFDVTGAVEPNVYEVQQL
jgi:hypothetical protein